MDKPRYEKGKWYVDDCVDGFNTEHEARVFAKEIGGTEVFQFFPWNPPACDAPHLDAF